MREPYYLFFHYRLLSCRYVMFHKPILSKPKWGGTSSLVLSGTRGANICSALGGIICNFTPILPYFHHRGDEPRQQFFSGEQIK